VKLTEWLGTRENYNFEVWMSVWLERFSIFCRVSQQWNFPNISCTRLTVMSEKSRQQGVKASRRPLAFCIHSPFLFECSREPPFGAEWWTMPANQYLRVLDRRWHERTYSSIENGYVSCPQQSAEGPRGMLSDRVRVLSYLILFRIWRVLSSGILCRVVQRKSADVSEEYRFHLQSPVS
jgi:hypothetical protein